MTNFLHLFFAKTFILFYSLSGAGLLNPPTVKPSTTPIPAAATPEPIVETKIVVQDLTKDKIKKYESEILGLKAQVLQWQSENNLLENRISQTFREIKGFSGTNPETIKVYPNDADSQGILTMFTVMEANESPAEYATIKMLQQEYDSATGYVAVATKTFVTDIQGSVKNLNLQLNRSAAGKPKNYYKFFVVEDEKERALFNFPTSN